VNIQPAQVENSQGKVFIVHSLTLKQLNPIIMDGFLRHYKDEDVKRTHLFNGRYENIYLDEHHIPVLKKLLDESCRYANHILSINNVSAGCWFNYMPAKAVTTLHSHDDYDEMLSAVYYIDVPDNSGNLIIHTGGTPVTIKPQSGMFIFFPPDIAHEVTENKSGQDRLSVGINFGIK